MHPYRNFVKALNRSMALIVAAGAVALGVLTAGGYGIYRLFSGGSRSDSTRTGRTTYPSEVAENRRLIELASTCSDSEEDLDADDEHKNKGFAGGIWQQPSLKKDKAGNESETKRNLQVVTPKAKTQQMNAIDKVEGASSHQLLSCSGQVEVVRAQPESEEQQLFAVGCSQQQPMITPTKPVMPNAQESEEQQLFAVGCTESSQQQPTITPTKPVMPNAQESEEQQLFAVGCTESSQQQPTITPTKPVMPNAQESEEQQLFAVGCNESSQQQSAITATKPVMPNAQESEEQLFAVGCNETSQQQSAITSSKPGIPNASPAAEHSITFLPPPANKSHLTSHSFPMASPPVAPKPKSKLSQKSSMREKGHVAMTPAMREKGHVAMTPAMREKGQVAMTPVMREKGQVAMTPAAIATRPKKNPNAVLVMPKGLAEHIALRSPGGVRSAGNRGPITIPESPPNAKRPKLNPPGAVRVMPMNMSALIGRRKGDGVELGVRVLTNGVASDEEEKAVSFDEPVQAPKLMAPSRNKGPSRRPPTTHRN